MSLYIRVKRKNQTVFLHVEPSNTFGQIKQRLAENFQLTPEQILLMHSDKKRELVDLATVSDQEIKSDDIIYMCFPKEGSAGFEEISVEQFVAFGEEVAEV